MLMTQAFSADRSSLEYFRLSIVEIQKVLSFEESISQSRGATGTLTKSEVRKIIKHTKKIAIANKESIICGWNLINKELKKYNTNFVPVDSEKVDDVPIEPTYV